METLSQSQVKRSLKSSAKNKQKLKPAYPYLQMPNENEISFTIDATVQQSILNRVSEVFNKFGTMDIDHLKCDGEVQAAFTKYFPGVVETKVPKMKNQIVKELKRLHFLEECPKKFWRGVLLGLNEVNRRLEQYLSDSSVDSPRHSPQLVLIDSAATCHKALNHLRQLCRSAGSVVLRMDNLPAAVSTSLRPLPRTLAVGLCRGCDCPEMEGLLDWTLEQVPASLLHEQVAPVRDVRLDDNGSTAKAQTVPESARTPPQFRPEDVYIFNRETQRIAHLLQTHNDRLMTAGSLVDTHQSETTTESAPKLKANVAVDELMLTYLERRCDEVPVRTNFHRAKVFAPGPAPKKMKLRTGNLEKGGKNKQKRRKKQTAA